MNEDLLMVMHSNKIFRFYSLEWIIENCTIINPRLGSEVEGPNGRGIIGDPDFGVPITVKLTGIGKFVCSGSYCVTRYYTGIIFIFQIAILWYTTCWVLGLGYNRY